MKEPPAWFKPGQHSPSPRVLAYEVPCPECYGGGALVAYRGVDCPVILVCDDCSTGYWTPEEIAPRVGMRRTPDWGKLATIEDLKNAGWDPLKFFRPSER